MSEILRSIVTRVRGSFVERRYAPRISVRLPFSISVQRTTTNDRPPIRFNGNTLDISANGLGLVFQSIRFDTYYLLRDGRPLNLVLELPSGPVFMKIKPVRYERLGDSGAHLIGAQIISVGEDHQQRYLAYILSRLRSRMVAI